MTEIKLYGDFTGKGRLHEMRWSIDHQRNVANCGQHTGIPHKIYLGTQLPDDADHCSRCLNGLRSPVAPKPNELRVSNSGLRAAFERSTLKAVDVADRANYVTSRYAEGRIVGTRPNTNKVRRLLGLILLDADRTTEYISREDALRLADAIGLDPVDVGL